MLSKRFILYGFLVTFSCSTILVMFCVSGREVRKIESLPRSEDKNNPEDLVEECMRATHIDTVVSSPQLLTDAKENARYLYEEFRKIIPQSSLEGYGSYCWEGSYSAHWNKSMFAGHIENISFSIQPNIHDVFKLSPVLFGLNSVFPQHSFNSNIVCLPKVFLIGFPKCGSTFTTCWIHSLLKHIGCDSISLHKEPPFWNNPSTHINMLTARDLGRYVLYFILGLQSISAGNKKAIMIDSKVANMYKWPRFYSSQHNLTNYCILPSVLPKLLPGSKYIVLMRNPVTMLYSMFWYSCKRLGRKLTRKTQLKGPDVFHSHVMTKLHLFNDCMRSSSIPSISHACKLDSEHNYTSCILHPQRMVLLDKCTEVIHFHANDMQMPNCGFAVVSNGLYYVHVRKWLSILPKEHFHFIFLEKLIQDSIQTSHDLLTFLDLNVTVTLKMTENFASSCTRFSQQYYKDDPQLHMREDTKSILESFYEPFNILLAKSLSISNLNYFW